MTGQLGNASNKFYCPFGLYIADRYNNRIQKYVKDVSFGETIAGDPMRINGTASNLLNLPCSMKVDLDGNIYVSDTSDQRIQLWKRGALNGTTIAGITGFTFFRITFS